VSVRSESQQHGSFHGYVAIDVKHLGLYFSVLFIGENFLIWTDGELYAGTVSDFSGLDPMIYREPLRTEQYDLKHLNGKTRPLIHFESKQTQSHALIWQSI
jgi:Sema domain